MPGSETLTVAGPCSKILTTTGKKDFSFCQNSTIGRATKIIIN